MKIQKCPKCKKAGLVLYMGGLFGKYKCKHCGYVGVLVIEEDVEEKSKSFKKKKTKKPHKR